MVVEDVSTSPCGERSFSGTKTAPASQMANMADHEVGAARELDGHRLARLHAGVRSGVSPVSATSCLGLPHRDGAIDGAQEVRSSAKGWWARRLARFSVLGMGVLSDPDGWLHIQYPFVPKQLRARRRDDEWSTASGRGASSPPFPTLRPPARDRPRRRVPRHGRHKLTAREVMAAAARIGGALHELGTQQHDRVATLIENSPAALWPGPARCARAGSPVPVNTAYKGEYLAPPADRLGLPGPGGRSQPAAPGGGGRRRRARPRARDRGGRRRDDEDAAGDGDGVGRMRTTRPGSGRPASHRWDEILAGGLLAPQRSTSSPSDLGTFIYTGGTTGLSKGCMLSHNYHEALARQIGICWRRTADDVVWTPLPLYHFNALATAVVGTLVFGGRGAIYRRFSVSQFWPEMNRVGRDHHLDARHHGLPAGPRRRPARDAPLGRTRGQHDPAAHRRGAAAGRGRPGRSGSASASPRSAAPTGSPRPAWSRGSRRASENRPNAAGVVNDEYFDVRIFDDDDDEVPPGTDGEIVLRPKRPHVMFEGYWGRPEVTVATSRNWWYHTGDIGRIDEDRYLYFVDRKADYLRRRGENIASFEVERILMGHGGLADVAVHAVPSALTEDDLKITATLQGGRRR